MLGLLTTATKVAVFTRVTIRPAEVLAMYFTWIDVLAEDACYARLVEWLRLIESHRTHSRNRDLISCQLEQGLADPVASHELFLTRIARVEVVAAGDAATSFPLPFRYGAIAVSYGCGGTAASRRSQGKVRGETPVL